MKRYRLTENRFRNIINESVRGILCELDWKTYMNAARKRRGQGLYDKADELERYAVQMFQKQHGKDGHSYNYEGDLPTSYQGRYDRGSNGRGLDSDWHFNVKAPTKEGWWGGEYADEMRSYRYGNGFPHLDYGELHDDTFDFASNNKEGWTGDQHRRHTMRYDKEGEHYSPFSSSVGNEISVSKDDDYNARQRRMAQDMEDYYTGKSHYVNGKGWSRKDESVSRLRGLVKEAVANALREEYL